MNNAHHTATSAFRALSNPDARRSLPACLDYTVARTDHAALAAAIRRGAESHGLDFDAAPRLTVAWPQKHPASGHVNAATAHAHQLQATLAEIFPDKAILRADALYETVHLGRSERWDMLYTLTGRQRFASDPALQDEPLPFLSPQGADGELFVLTDWIVMQGTTMANLASFIAHNGGHVAAVAAPGGGKALRQEQGRADRFQQGVPSRGQLQPLAAAFNRAALGNGDYDGAECVALFDYALARHSLNLDTLTHGESLALYAEMNGRDGGDFTRFIENLGVGVLRQRDFIQALRRAGGPR